NSLNVPDNEPIEHKMLSSAIERAQKRIEGNNFGIRKALLEYDQVKNEQREIIYAERRRVLDGENMRDQIMGMITDTVEKTVDRVIPEGTPAAEWDLGQLNAELRSIIPLSPIKVPEGTEVTKAQLKQDLKQEAFHLYEAKEAELPEPEKMREIERVILLRVVDNKWMSHIDDMDQLRQGIGLQAMAQKDPLVEYKNIGFDMFDEMNESIETDTVRLLTHIRIEQKVEREEVAKVTGTNKDDTAKKDPKKRENKKIYPNDPCPCGSGKKYKQCCMNKRA
ncbi:MAG: SEC-C domain-containing protein, partial [Lachnospiraceae bacterium]|nr:SEC-C domain-containing protein [Lachnospiraceae bacterium]